MPTRSYRALKASAKKRRARRTAWGSTLPAPETVSLRKAPVKARNAERHDKEWTRAYGSEERVAFLKSLPCLICGVVPSECAHVGREGAGASRKSNADQTVPLCHAHHEELHRTGEIVREGGPRTDMTFTKEGLALCASQIERAWQQHGGENVCSSTRGSGGRGPGVRQVGSHVQRRSLLARCCACREGIGDGEHGKASFLHPFRPMTDSARDVFNHLTNAILGGNAEAAMNFARAYCDFYPEVAQLLDGWHQDGTAWGQWDESVRQRLWTLRRQAEVTLKGHAAIADWPERLNITAATPKDEARRDVTQSLDADGLMREMVAQASLGHKRFCVGVHPQTEDSPEQAEWEDWSQTFERLAARIAAPKDEARPDAEREADLQTAYNDGYSDAKAGLFASGPRGDARKDEAAPTVTAHEDVERIVAMFDAWDSDHTGTSFNRLRDAINGVRKVERPMWYCIQCEAESEWPDRMTMHSANTGHQPFYGTRADRDHHRGVVGKGSTTPKSTPTGRDAKGGAE